MVLLELGEKITTALSNLQKSNTITDQTLQTCLNHIGIALLQGDVSIHQVKPLQESIKSQFKLTKETGGNLEKSIKQALFQELINLLEVDKKPLEPKKGKTSIVMFVGLQGSGKTTTCTKYAYFWARKNYRVGLVCADTFRAGAFDQLKQNASKIKVPFYGSYTETDPVQITKEGVETFKKEKFDLIIIDTSGRHYQEESLFEEMKQIEKAVNPDECIFTMDSSIGQACYDQAKAFKKAVKVGSVIITKLDGHAKGGGALSAVAATESPISFIGTGEHFTDLQQFNAKSFIKRLLKWGDLESMVNIVKEAVSDADQQKMMERIQSGKFDYNDMRTQFQSVLKLGPLNQFISMIPGGMSQLVGQANDKQSEQANLQRVKKQICMLDSMTKQELNCEVQIDESRMRRIVRGSGASIQDFEMMQANFKQIQGMIKRFKGMNLGNDNMNLMMRDKKMLQEKLQKAMDPRQLQQMGGIENIMGMMKEFEGMEKKGELGDLMKMMGGGKGKGKGKRK